MAINLTYEELQELTAALHKRLMRSQERGEALTRARMRLHDLLKEGPTVVYTCTLDDCLTATFVSENAKELLGYETWEFLKKPGLLAECVHPEDRPRVLDRLSLLQRDGRHIHEYRFRCKDGSYRWVREELRLIGDKRHGTVEMVGYLMDVTERKLAEEALRKSEERYLELYDSAPDMYFTVSPDGTLFSVNRSGAEQLGYTKNELMGQPVWVIVHPDDLQMVREHVTRIFEEKMLKSELDFRKVRKDGSTLWVSERTRLVVDSNGSPSELRIVCRDVTERKKAEDEMLRSQKIDSLGTLAGGIAHDFNNLLTGILGNISLVRVGRELSPEANELLGEAEKASLRAKQLASQLLTFARGGTQVKRPTSMPSLLKEATHFALRGSGVSCEFAFPDDMWPADVDEGQVIQVIHNLITNARQAMPEGGIIRVRAENVPAGLVKAVPLKTARYVRMSIEDRGIGISAGSLGKIFDPYFSTKEEGRGLGLAVSRSIVEKHDGHIEVESAPGVGTIFTVYLPAAEDSWAERRQADDEEQSRHEAPRNKGRILVMDDEETVGRIARQILVYLGFSVALANDGVEAVELYKLARESGRPYDAVILDLTVPGGMGGKEAIKRLLDIDPDVKAIVSSGYSNDPVMADHRAFGFHGILTKPYDVAALRWTLHGVLATKAT